MLTELTDEQIEEIQREHPHKSREQIQREAAAEQRPSYSLPAKLRNALSRKKKLEAELQKVEAEEKGGHEEDADYINLLKNHQRLRDELSKARGFVLDVERRLKKALGTAPMLWTHEAHDTRNLPGYDHIVFDERMIADWPRIEKLLTTEVAESKDAIKKYEKEKGYLDSMLP